MVKIIVDSCSDLSPELIKRFDIEVIPLSILVDGQTYLDGVELSTSQLFESVKKTGVLPKTSAPSVAAFTNVFEKHDEFIYLSISSKLSASFQSAHLALEALPKSHKGKLIDSLNLSTGIGLLALRAAELSQQGKSMDEIVKEVTALIDNVNTSFMIDTLDYLYMGGRCSAMEHIFGSILKIKPIIEVRKDGTLGVKEKINGSRKKCLNSLLEDFSKKKDIVDPGRVFVTHVLCPDDAAFLKTELEKIMPIDEVCITDAGSTVASHCGIGTIGILFIQK